MEGTSFMRSHLKNIHAESDVWLQDKPLLASVVAELLAVQVYPVAVNGHFANITPT